MNRTARRWLTAAGLSVSLVGALALPALANHSWGSYHWARTANPFTIKLGDNVSSTWDSYLRTASSDWSKSTVLDTTIVAGGTSAKNCRPTSGRGEVCNATYGNTGWLGVAQIWASGDHITQGVVKLNDTYFNTAQYNTPAWRQLVTCQEVGHIFGLDHQDENFDNQNLGTCMDYTNDPSTNQHPNQHDYAELESIYSHLDSTTTISSATVDPNSDLNHPSDWGKLVHRSANGHSAIYKKDLGDGNTLLTHVFWAEPQAESDEHADK
jgi:hypothetical protein